MPNPQGVVILPVETHDVLVQALTVTPPSSPLQRLAPFVAATEVKQRGNTQAAYLPVPTAETARTLAAFYADRAATSSGAAATAARTARDRFLARAEVLTQQERILSRWRLAGSETPVPTKVLNDLLDAGMDLSEVARSVGMSRAGVHKRVGGRTTRKEAAR